MKPEEVVGLLFNKKEEVEAPKKRSFGARKVSTHKAAIGDRNHKKWKKARASGKN